MPDVIFDDDATIAHRLRDCSPERNHLRPFGTILGPTWPPRTPVYNFLDPECRKTPLVHQNRNAHAVKLYFMAVK